MRYSVKEACQALQVSDRTLRRAIKTGDLPAQREPWGGGDRLTLDPGDLAAWAQAAGRPMIPLDNVTKALPAGNTGGEEADRWRDYAEELERWHSLGWWARRRQRRPEPPN